MINDLRSTLAKSVTADIMAIVLNLALTHEHGLKLAEAGVQFSIEPLDNCFEIKISGHCSKLLDATEIIMEFLYNSEPTAEDIETAVSVLREQYKHMSVEPSNQSRQLRLTFLQHHQYLYIQKLNYLQNISQAELNLSHVKVFVYISGNFSSAQATGISEFFEGLLFAADGKKLKYLTPRTVTLLPEEIVQWSQNSNDESQEESVIEIYFQLGQASIEERVCTSLLEIILSQNAQEEIVQKSISQTIAISSRMTRGVSGILVKAITIENHPDFVYTEIFQYLEKTLNNAKELFDNSKNCLMEAKKQHFLTFYDKCNFY